MTICVTIHIGAELPIHGKEMQQYLISLTKDRNMPRICTPLYLMQLKRISEYCNLLFTSVLLNLVLRCLIRRNRNIKCYLETVQMQQNAGILSCVGKSPPHFFFNSVCKKVQLVPLVVWEYLSSLTGISSIAVCPICDKITRAINELFWVCRLFASFQT